MARKKLNQSVPTGFGEVDDMFAAWSADQRERELGAQILNGGSVMDQLEGLYIPHLILRYLFQSTILPLGRTLQIAGVPGSNKSTFLFWLYWLFRQNGGRGYHIENESKDAEERRLAILKWDKNAVQTIIAQSLEEWQNAVTWLVSERGNQARGPSIKEIMTARGLKGKIPIIIGVDPLTGTAKESSIETIMKDGHASMDRSQQFNAQVISKWLKAIPPRFGDWPFFFVCTNHLKLSYEQINAFTQKKVENVPGGFSIKFAETYQIHCEEVKASNTGYVHGGRYRMRTAKNSLGAGNLTVEYEVSSWLDPDKMSPTYGRQCVHFDWDAATVELILGSNHIAFKDRKTFVKDMCDLTGIRDASNKRCYSKILGVPASDPVDYATMGKLLESAPSELMDTLHILLGIQSRKIFKPAFTFDAQSVSVPTQRITTAENMSNDYVDEEDADADEEVTDDPTTE